jgi:DNA processing protein
VAVVGTGADVVYPAQHRELAQAIAAHGAIVSEWPLATPAKPAHFPQRNRLIAGLTKGVLVVEAALRSGSLITARLANEMGRDVFAIPGSIHSPLSRGSHQLIKDGAMLTETPADVYEGLGLESAKAPVSGTESEDDAPHPWARPSVPKTQTRRRPARQSRPPAQPPAATLPLFATPRCAKSCELSSAAKRVLAALGHAPAALEILAARTEMGSATLQGALLELELRGYLAVLPGGRYVRYTEG